MKHMPDDRSLCSTHDEGAPFCEEPSVYPKELVKSVIARLENNVDSNNHKEFFVKQSPKKVSAPYKDRLSRHIFEL